MMKLWGIRHVRWAFYFWHWHLVSRPQVERHYRPPTVRYLAILAYEHRCNVWSGNE